MNPSISEETFSMICVAAVTLMVAAVYVLAKYAK